jgi:hypothetical protein
MRSVVPRKDVRTGWDEFVAIVSDAGDELLSLILDRFKIEIAAMNQFIKNPQFIEYTAGVASFPT